MGWEEGRVEKEGEWVMHSYGVLWTWIWALMVGDTS